MTEPEFGELQFSELGFVSRMSEKEQARQVRERMTAAAFTAWLQGAGGEDNFPQFLRRYGLIEKEKPITDEKKKRMIKKSKEIEKRILAKLRKQRKK